nr:hypothetical protein [Polymorphobacter sp.]
MTALSPITSGELLTARRLAITTDAAALSAIAAAAIACGWPTPEPQRGLAPAIRAIERGAPPSLIIADIDNDPDPLAALARLADHCLPDTQVLAIGSSSDIGLFRALLAIGVDDYLQKPVAPETLVTALHRIAATALPPAPTGRLVAVLGVRGGCGATTIATSLAWALADAQRNTAQSQSADSMAKTILVDLDLHFGSAGLVFGLEPGPGLAALLASADRLDERLVASALQPATANLGIIAGSTPIEQNAAVSPDAAMKLLAALRTTAQWVVADLPRALDAPARHILRTADTVLLVAPPSLEGLRDTGRLAAYVRALRAGADPLIVVNGAQHGQGLSHAMFQAGLDDMIAAWIPALPGPAAAAAAHALPLAAVANVGRIANPFETLAGRITGNHPTRPSRLQGWWPWRR